MKIHTNLRPRWAALLVILVIAGMSCSKMTPTDPEANPATSKTTVTTTATAKNAHSRCKPGMPLATSGEFQFIVDSNVRMVGSVLGDHIFPAINYAEFVYAPEHVFDLSSTCNLSEHIYHFKYYINAEIRDLHRNLLLSINDNKWQVFRNAAGKYNYDDNGLEVYDKEGRIAFSFDFVGGEWQYSYFRGIIPCTDSTLGYYPYNFFINNFPYGTRQLNEAFDHFYDSLPIQPLFRYTGKDWQHSRL